MRNVDNANMGPANLIIRLRELNIPVRVAENVFDYSKTYREKG
jgi:hypothetical protein